jgi:uncharacterized glyoxalase superfamily protein PhnB
MAVRKSRPAPRKGGSRPSSRKSAARPARAKSAAGENRLGLQVERRKRDPETLRLRAFEPSLTVNDVQRSLRFYTDVLGFIEGRRWNDDGGKLQGAMLKAGVCELGLSQDNWAKGRDRAKGEGFRLWCRTEQDIDALASRIKRAGHALTEEPKTQSWGARSLAVDDPDGFHITIYREQRS